MPGDFLDLIYANADKTRATTSRDTNSRGAGGRRMQGSDDPLYGSSAWKRVRLEALRRDGYRCVICGVDVGGSGQAVVDHIETVKDRPDLALALSNLRILCREHDSQSHRERRGGGKRRTQFTIRGCDERGFPLDPNHPWNREGD